MALLSSFWSNFLSHVNFHLCYSVVDFKEDATATMISEAESLLYKNNLHLAEIYDIAAFFYTNRDNLQFAFEVRICS